MLRSLMALIAIGALLSSPPLAGARDLEPRDVKKCGSVRTSNGGQARWVRAIGVGCRLARRTARRANGKRYRAFRFKCSPRRRRGISGKVYGCGRAAKGRGQGIGFVYRAP